MRQDLGPHGVGVSCIFPGFIRDAGRSLCLIVASLLFAAAIAFVPLAGLAHGVWISWAAIAGGICAAFGGALRSAGVGARRHWLFAGLVAGLLLVLVR